MRKGSQKPTLESLPYKPNQVSYEDGELAIQLADAYGLTLLPWQEHVVRCILATWKKDGTFAAINSCLGIPRQQGKTHVLVVIMLYALLVLQYRVLFTSHRVDTSMDVFRRLAPIFEEHPDLAQISKVRRSNGSQMVECTIDGVTSFVEFKTRSNNSGRGNSGINLLIYDEAQTLTSDQSDDLDALTLATGEKGCLTLYTGTPPKPDEAGDVFVRLRRNIIEGKSSDTS